MLIHSVTPAHLLTPQTEIQASSIKPVSGGYLEGVDTPQGFRLSRVCSTDPALYLRKDMSPGSFYRAF